MKQNSTNNNYITEATDTRKITPIEQISNDKKTERSIEPTNSEKATEKESHNKLPRKLPWVYKKDITYMDLKPLKCVTNSRDSLSVAFSRFVISIDLSVLLLLDICFIGVVFLVSVALVI